MVRKMRKLISQLPIDVSEGFEFGGFSVAWFASWNQKYLQLFAYAFCH